MSLASLFWAGGEVLVTGGTAVGSESFLVRAMRYIGSARRQAHCEAPIRSISRLPTVRSRALAAQDI